MIVLNWLSRGLFIAVLNDVAQLVAAWPITRAVALGLLTPGPHKFSVTAKGGDRTKVVIQWPLMAPFLLLFALTIGGLVVSLTSDFIFNNAARAGDGMAVVMFWTVYNLVVLLIAIAACIERPRPDRPQRQIVEPVTLTMAGQEHRGWLVNLGVGGARVSGLSGLQPGTTGTLRLRIIGDVEARVIAPTQDGYRIGFAPTVEQRDRIIARLYTASAAPGTNQGNIALMIRELARTLTR
jgi:cellulose synthase (UDP-forming)